MPGSSPQPTEKKRRIQRACDPCRRKKVKCDGGIASGGRCASCIVLEVECTWDDVIKKRGPRRKHVDALEARLEYLESLIQAIPVGAASATPPSPHSERPESSGDIASGLHTPESDGSDDEDEIVPLAKRVAALDLAAEGWVRPLGTSSGHRLATKVITMKQEEVPDSPEQVSSAPRPHGEVEFHKDSWEEDELQDTLAYLSTMCLAPFAFPDPDRIPTLIATYLRHDNVFTPIVHGPTFIQRVQDGLHLRDPSFACVLLAVCALAERRLARKSSAGWQWFAPARRYTCRRDLLATPRLFDMQAMLLIGTYSAGAFKGHLNWVLIGVGIRMAQEIDVHRKEVYGSVPNVHDEEWKRCFWVLMCMDVNCASEMGRSCTLCDGDFDLALPVDCDDEYWCDPDPAKAFKQPADKPSHIAAFIHTCRLKKVHLRAMRSLFSGKFAGTASAQAALADIDSALNSWQESTPQHLTWDHPDGYADDILFQQAAMLRIEVNHLRITIHRPFVAVRKPTTGSAASQAICTNAARANARILAAQMRSPSVQAHTMITAHSAAVVLLLGLWGARRMQMRVDTQAVLADVNKCIDAVYACGDMYRVAYSLHAGLVRLASQDFAPLPEARPGAASKRRMTDDEQPSPSVLPATALHGTTPPSSSSTYSHSQFSPTTSALPTSWLQQSPFTMANGGEALASSPPADHSTRVGLNAGMVWAMPIHSPDAGVPTANAMHIPGDIPHGHDTAMAGLPPDVSVWDDELMSMWSNTGTDQFSPRQGWDGDNRNLYYGATSPRFPGYTT